MACEKAVQRVHRAASDASAAAPRLLTFLVSPAALTRALIVRRAEALHEWRNTILLQASASGAVGACLAVQLEWPIRGHRADAGLGWRRLLSVSTGSRGALAIDLPLSLCLTVTSLAF